MTDGSTRYYATYTAFDGKIVLPQLLETDDFLHFRDQHAQRTGSPKQRIRTIPAENRRPLRHALAQDRREHLS